MNKNWRRLTGWLLALVMILTVLPAATFAEADDEALLNDEVESDTMDSPPMEKRPAEADITADTSFIYTAGGNAVALADMDPNMANSMTLTVSGLDGQRAIGDKTKLAVKIPANIRIKDMESFNSTAVEAELSDDQLILTWINGKQASFTATVAVTPNVPAENDLSGSYALITKKNVMVGSTAYSDKGRNKLKSYTVKEVSGMIEPQTDERSIWKLTHVSGDYYTVYSQTAAKYLKIELPNHVVLESVGAEDAQKILVRKTSDGFYTFTYSTVNLNNSGNNANNGFASYTSGNADNEKFKLISASSIVYNDALLFNINGGTGDDAPEGISAEAGTKVTLPGLNATKNGQEFIGWADVKDFYSRVSGTNHTYHELYKAGSTYTVKGGKNTLYAVYNSSTRKVQFGIRKDGVIQDEPNGYPVDAYCGHFTVEGILKDGYWVIDIDPTKPVNGYYVQNNVTAALNWVPSSEQIAEALKKEGNIDFDPESQYIHYYVLKNTSATVWKVDGVIRNKAKVGITYDTNVPDGVDKTKVSNLPGGYQMVPGTDILIGADQGSTEIKRPILNGYYFMGWNTKKDGSGKYYSESGTVHLTENLYLYAQWVSASDNPLAIRITSDWPAGKTGYVGARIKLTATLTGFDDRIYTLQWQYTTDPESGEWHDVPDAHDVTYTYTLDEETTHYTWRVVAQDIR